MLKHGVVMVYSKHLSAVFHNEVKDIIVAFLELRPQMSMLMSIDAINPVQAQ